MKTALILLTVLCSFFVGEDQEMMMLDGSDYSISYPTSWQLDQSDRVTEFYLFSPLDGPDDHFNENMNLIAQNLVGVSVNLDQYTQISVNQIKKFFKDEILKVQKHKNKDGLEYYEVLYRGEHDGMKLKFLQYNFLKNGRAYVLTFTSEESQFEKFKPLVYKTFNSFTIKNGTNN